MDLRDIVLRGEYCPCLDTSIFLHAHAQNMKPSQMHKAPSGKKEGTSADVHLFLQSYSRARCSYMPNFITEKSGGP